MYSLYGTAFDTATEHVATVVSDFKSFMLLDSHLKAVGRKG